MIPSLDKNYWESRWEQRLTGWDVGYASTPIAEYIDQLERKDLDILIPGCGNAWEGEYLLRKGFTNTKVIDIAPLAIEAFASRIPEFPREHLICGDFFEHLGSYDIIIEQTFFCALNPAERRRYAEKMHSLLKPQGRLVGLLFDDRLNDDHPPFGGSREEYLGYFSDLFELHTFEMAYNSIKPRENRELFINLRKRS